MSDNCTPGSQGWAVSCLLIPGVSRTPEPFTGDFCRVFTFSRPLGVCLYWGVKRNQNLRHPWAAAFPHLRSTVPLSCSSFPGDKHGDSNREQSPSGTNSGFLPWTQGHRMGLSIGHFSVPWHWAHWILEASAGIRSDGRGTGKLQPVCGGKRFLVVTKQLKHGILSPSAERVLR